MLSLDVPRVTLVVAFLLFATAIGHVLVSGEVKSHIKRPLYSPPVTIEVDQTAPKWNLHNEGMMTSFLSRLASYAPDLMNPFSLPFLDGAVKSNAFSREDCQVYDKTYTVLLISPGGTGSTSGFKYFQRNFGLNKTQMNDLSDGDGLKHLNFASLFHRLIKCQLDVKMIVYQFGDPVDSVFSLYRRDFAKVHFLKLEPPFSQKQCSQGIMTNSAAYANQTADLLGLRKHFESYLTASLVYPIVFLKSSTRESPDVMTRLQEIMIHFGVTKEVRNIETSELPTLRKSGYREEPRFDDLTRTYKPFSEMLERFGNISLAAGGIMYTW